MSRLNKKIVSLTLSLHPDLSFSGGYFYITPVKKIMCGFTCDPGQGNTFYVAQFVFPTYLGRRSPTLLFGDRLPSPDGVIHTAKTDYPTVSREFGRRIESYRNRVCEISEPSRFLEFLKDRKQTSSSIWAVWANALTNLVLENETEAKWSLIKLEAMAGMSMSNLKPNIEAVSTALLRGREEYTNLLSSWRDEFVRGLDGS